MAEPAKPKDEWAGMIKPYVGQMVLHYKTASKSDQPAPAMVMKLGSNCRIQGIRFILGGMYYEPFQGAAFMDRLFNQEGQPMTETQKSNIGGWDHTEETKENHRLRSEFERMGRTVVELSTTVNNLIDRLKQKPASTSAAA